MSVVVTAATESELDDLADVAAVTFPLACPPSATPENVAAFIAENLSRRRFAEYLTDQGRVVLCAHEHGRMLGYAMLIRGVIADAEVQQAVPLRPAVELSKMILFWPLPPTKEIFGEDAPANDAPEIDEPDSE